jgi:hypothetical protein
MASDPVLSRHKLKSRLDDWLVSERYDKAEITELIADAAQALQEDEPAGVEQLCEAIGDLADSGVPVCPTHTEAEFICPECFKAEQASDAALVPRLRKLPRYAFDQDGTIYGPVDADEGTFIRHEDLEIMLATRVREGA